MIGIMQGRLSPMRNNKIQSFPVKFWKAEFFIAEGMGIPLIEWTLDYDLIDENPLMNDHPAIFEVTKITETSVNSVTYDVAMQQPLVTNGKLNPNQVDLLYRVLDNSLTIGIKVFVLPLVDDSTVIKSDYPIYVDLLRGVAERFTDQGLKIAIESDFPPRKLKKFVDDIGSKMIGINYDTGNSAALGYDFEEEMEFTRFDIVNIHVKDRPFGGITCPLGTGKAGLETKLKYFSKFLPETNMIIQGARSASGNDIGIVNDYLKYIKNVIRT